MSLHDSLEAKSAISSPTLGRALRMVDSPDVVRDHSSQQVSSPESSSHSKRNGEHQGSAPRNLETEIA